MTIQPIAYFRSPLTSKFGLPRQSGLVDELRGSVEFVSDYADAEALRGLEQFDYVWLVWGFSANADAPKRPTVRPPRLGGNTCMGVFATRSPFRPNNLGLSSVRVVAIRHGGNKAMAIDVAGADLMDGTPIYDVKPYIPFTDSHPMAHCGFVDANEWRTLSVAMPEPLAERLPKDSVQAVKKLLAQDPRPQYHDDPERIYGMAFGGFDIRFRVDGRVLTVVDIARLLQKSR